MRKKKDIWHMDSKEITECLPMDHLERQYKDFEAAAKGSEQHVQ